MCSISSKARGDNVLPLCVDVHVCVFMCVNVSECGHVDLRPHTHTHTHLTDCITEIIVRVRVPGTGRRGPGG